MADESEKDQVQQLDLMGGAAEPVTVGTEVKLDPYLNDEVAWRGLPKFVPKAESFQLAMSCDTAEQRDDLVERLGLKYVTRGKTAWSAWWPDREREDLASLRFDFGDTVEGW